MIIGEQHRLGIVNNVDLVHSAFREKRPFNMMHSLMNLIVVGRQLF